MTRRCLVTATLLCSSLLAGPTANAAAAEHSAIAPVSRKDAWWVKRHESFNARAKKGDVDLIFVGDSITHAWEGPGKNVWQKFYGSRKAMNLGIGGDRTQHVLWRLDHGNLDGIAPKAAVLMIGTNNSNGADNTAEQIADGIIAIVEKLRAKQPQMKVLIVAVFPRGEKPSAQREKNAKASQLASKIADGKMIHYIDIGKNFLEDDGTLTKEMMPDFLHPTEKGYVIWAESIETKVAELLGEK